MKPDGEFGELLKLFGDAGEARGEHGGDPIARRRPALPEMDRKHYIGSVYDYTVHSASIFASLFDDNSLQMLLYHIAVAEN